MKIRQGFVSNSSSSSFHMYGTEIDDTEFEKMIIEKGLTTAELLEADGISEFLWVAGIPGLQGEHILDWGNVYLGRCYAGIGDDETGKEFKESTKKALEEFLGKDVKCEEYFETYND